MITLTAAEINQWMISFFWPLARILALVAAAPVLGNTAIPMRVKILAWARLSPLVIAPMIETPPKIDPASLEGLLVLGQQILIGLAMGFAMRIIFSGVEMAGEITGWHYS